MRALITGITGFVGRYLQTYLLEQGIEVYGTSRKPQGDKSIYQINLYNEKDIFNMLHEVRPTHIFHLAGESNVKNSWLHVNEYFEANTITTIHLFEAVKKLREKVRIITIGSSEEYGAVNTVENITEETPINPVNPYGVSKAAISMLSKQYFQAFGLDVIHLRPFNHIGPGQRLGFVTSDFAYQIAKINKSIENEPVIKVGNLDAIRDFTDVRDIVKAYYLIALKGKSGEIYNICSGKGIKIMDILNILLSYSKIEIKKVIDHQKMRPIDVPSFIGANVKVFQDTGWNPKISINRSLLDIYKYWLDKIS
jgi:GDP-4-dehydro-6-deoxy-D-mannose reductase